MAMTYWNFIDKMMVCPFILLELVFHRTTGKTTLEKMLLILSRGVGKRIFAPLWGRNFTSVGDNSEQQRKGTCA